MGLICTRESQFGYFDRQLGGPAWRGKRILDFGGNIGGFLAGADGRVRHEDYWCSDLNQTALEQGRQAFPHAHFIHYDAYSSEYNPTGAPGLPVPDLGRFDMILAFSVFTHIESSQMLALLDQLEAMLAPDGVLAFTFCDHRYDKSLTDPTSSPETDLEKMLRETKEVFPDIDIQAGLDRAANARWCLLVDDVLYIEPDAGVSQTARTGKPFESYCSYFTAEHMAELVPHAEILPPVSPEWQHCAVIRKPA